MLVGLEDYFQLRLSGAYDGCRENGNLDFLELIKRGKEKKIFFEEYNKKNHKKYSLIILFNEPRITTILKILFRNLFIKKIDLIYFSGETPISRPRYSLLFPRIYKKILINCIGSEKLSKKRNYFLFTTACIPSRAEIIENKNMILKTRNKLLCFIAANKIYLSKKTSYIFRNNFVSSLSKNKNFSLYGKFWDEIAIPGDLPFLSIIIRVNLLKKFFKKIYSYSHKNTVSKGSVKSKLKTMYKYKFSLAIEPYIAEPKMVLEKIFDPMLVGSIPVYYGNEIKEIPDDVYIRITEKTNPNELMEHLESINEEELGNYRKRIYEFLISDKANRFRYSFFANQILDIMTN